MLRDNEWHIIQLINGEEITLSIEQFKKYKIYKIKQMKKLGEKLSCDYTNYLST